MNGPPPFFSVLIPSYNRPEYLTKAAASVLEGAFADIELLVSDDKSPRQSEIIAALAPWTGDSRLRFTAQATNLGEARNRHFLMKQARGRYRLIMGDDDILAPHALRRLHEIISAEPTYDLYLFGYEIIDGAGRIFERRRALASFALSLRHARRTQDLFCADLHPFWFYHPATFCFTAALHEHVVPNAAIGIGDDLMFLCDALLAGKQALVIPEVLFSYRKFMGPEVQTQSNLSRTRLANLITRRHILYALMNRPALPPALGEFICSRTFRTRLLYDSVAADPDATDTAIASLELLPAHQRELKSFLLIRRNRWFQKWAQLRRIIAFARYFGPAAFVETFRVMHQRRTWRQTVQRMGAAH